MKNVSVLKISGEENEKIFEEFFRLNTSVKELQEEAVSHAMNEINIMKELDRSRMPFYCHCSFKNTLYVRVMNV